MAFRLFLLFVVLPIVELALLIQVGQYIGVAYTIGILFATGIVGAYLARQQGFTVYRRFQQRTQAGEMPGEEIVDGVIILVCGALLVTPGVLTDVLGFVGLIPFTRNFLKNLIRNRLVKAATRSSIHVRYSSFSSHGNSAHSPEEHDPERIPPDDPGEWK